MQETAGNSGLRIGEEEFMDGTPRSAARWRAALAELEAADALEVLRDGVYRLTATGYRLTDTDGGSPIEARASAFQERQRTRTRELLDALACKQRDLLRFLLLQGGSARSDIIQRAWNSKLPFDWSGLTKSLAERGLITINQDRIEGHATLFVNESMSNLLQDELYPREENAASDFSSV